MKLGDETSDLVYLQVGQPDFAGQFAQPRQIAPVIAYGVRRLPALPAEPYRFAADGTAFLLPAWGGLVYNVSVGDPAFGWAADCIHPGASIRQADDMKNRGLLTYACVGNRATVMTGQAAGTRGRSLVEGARELKIHGQWVPIAAEVKNLSMLSAHADAGEILRWLSGFKRPPSKVFIVHGEPHASDALRLRIRDRFQWECVSPQMRDRHAL